MKAKIKVKELVEGCLPSINPKGDWIDLKSASDIKIPVAKSYPLKKRNKDDNSPSREVIMQTYYIPLGVAIKLPAGYEAIVASRSSGPKKIGVFIPNGIGIIDNSFSGNNDGWSYVCSAMAKNEIKRGDRICQFRIQLSQKATLWQKIKWLFTSGVEIVKVDNLDDTDRGGLGSTGV